jgi:coproporphyrinogen III oxidase-like Fe-S oxidoreductase
MFDEYIVEREQYLGAGSGAFSYLAGSLFANTFSIDDYCRRVNAGETGAEWRHDMSETHQMRYYLLMRLFGGSMSLTTANERFSGRFRRKMWPELAALKTMGSVRAVGDVIQLTENGYYLWCVLMREFFLGINGLRDHMRHRHIVPSSQTNV